jgi:hypothetical protein
MAIVLRMESAVMQAVEMVAVRHLGMLMIFLAVPLICLDGRNEGFRNRISGRYADHVLIGVGVVGMVQVALMQIVDMTCMSDGLMTASFGVLVLVVGMNHFVCGGRPKGQQDGSGCEGQNAVHG